MRVSLPLRNRPLRLKKPPINRRGGRRSSISRQLHRNCSDLRHENPKAKRAGPGDRDPGIEPAAEATARPNFKNIDLSHRDLLGFYLPDRVFIEANLKDADFFRLPLKPLVHKGYLGTPGRTRTSSLRIRSPSRHNPLTGGNTHEPRRKTGFECSPVCSTLHQFSMKRVLSASWDTVSDPAPSTGPCQQQDSAMTAISITWLRLARCRAAHLWATQRHSDSVPFPTG